MKPRLLSMRPSVTRTSRHDPRGTALESVAAEFSLLAQRRARLARQLDVLKRQLSAASGSLEAVQARMSMLAQRMDGIDPSLRQAANAAPLLAQIARIAQTAQTAQTAHAAPARGSVHMQGFGAPRTPLPAAAGALPDAGRSQQLTGLQRSLRQMPRRRTFLPD